MKKVEMAAVVLFAVLTIAGVGMTVLGASLSESTQLVLISLGSAMFAGALAFFLVEMFKWVKE